MLGFRRHLNTLEARQTDIGMSLTQVVEGLSWLAHDVEARLGKSHVLKIQVEFLLYKEWLLVDARNVPDLP